MASESKQESWLALGLDVMGLKIVLLYSVSGGGDFSLTTYLSLSLYVSVWVCVCVCVCVWDPARQCYGITFKIQIQWHLMAWQITTIALPKHAANRRTGFSWVRDPCIHHTSCSMPEEDKRCKGMGGRDRAGVNCASWSQAGYVHTPQMMQTNKDFLARTTQTQLRTRKRKSGWHLNPRSKDC